MTVGEKLKNRLGLGKIQNVSICRVLVSAIPIYLVYYSSSSPNMPITTYRVRNSKIANIFNGADVEHNKSRKQQNIIPAFAPLMPIEQYGGNLAGIWFITVDLAGLQLVNSNLIESENSFVETVSYSWFGKFSDLKKLYEEVYLSDFKKFGMSDYGMKFRKEKNKLMGSESKTSKLISVELQDRDLLISFLTEPTEAKYPDNYKYKQVNPETLKLEPNPSKLYQTDIMIIDFLDWLETYPNKETITEKDIKDIFDVSAIKLFSNIPSFQYQGSNYYLSVLDGSLHPTDIIPKFWNDETRHGDSNNFLDKATYGIIQQYQFWKNPLASMVTKYLRDRGLLPLKKK